MNLTYLFAITTVILLIVIGLLISSLTRIKKRLSQIIDVIDIILSGNLNRRILALEDDITSEICYKINEIALQYKEKLIQAERTETANRKLITSFSHDIRTPLTTLIGYLDAIQARVVIDKEREQYITIAQSKAYQLKNYTDTLFEFLKLHSREKILNFELIDINEITRNIIIDWIPHFEQKSFTYEVLISDNEALIKTDISAYSRIVNNLIQNAVQHSTGNHITIIVQENSDSVSFMIEDNGKGIQAENLTYIFERLYKCDEASTESGSGLGLSIVKELTNALGGKCMVDSLPHIKTVFTVNFPLFIQIKNKA